MTAEITTKITEEIVTEIVTETTPKRNTNIDLIKNKVQTNFYGAVGEDTSKLKSKLIKTKSTKKLVDDEVGDSILQADIHKIVKHQESKLNKILTPLIINEDGVLEKRVKQITKSDINLMFGIISKELKWKYPYIELYSGISHYFSIDSTIFYRKLNTKYKDLLISEHAKNSDFLASKGVLNLF